MNTQARQGMFVLTVMATLGVAGACKDDNAPRSQSRITQPPTPASQASARKAKDVRAQTAWVGKLHNDALADLIAQRKALGKFATATAVCGTMLSTLENHLVRAEQQQGVVRGVNERRRLVSEAGARHFKTCRQEIGPASMFAAPRLALPTPVPEGYVTGAFEPYVEQLQNVINGGYGSPSEVNAALNSVVESAAAAGIPEADLNVVAATAGLGASSASYWYSTVGSAGVSDDDCFEETCENNDIYMTSVFKRRRAPWALVAWGLAAIDLVGCIKSEVEDYRKGNVSEGDMYANCAINGVSSSATAGIRYLMK